MERSSVYSHASCGTCPLLPAGPLLQLLLSNLARHCPNHAKSGLEQVWRASTTLKIQARFSLNPPLKLGYETQKPLVKLDGFLAVKLRSVPEARLLPSQTSLGKFALVGFCLIPEESSVDRSLHSDAPSRSHAHVQPTLPWVFCTGDGRRTCQQVGGVHLAAGQEQLLMDSATNG